MQEKVINWCEVVEGDEEVIHFSGCTTVGLGCRQQFLQKQIDCDVLRGLQNCWKGIEEAVAEFPGISASDGEAAT